MRAIAAFSLIFCVSFLLSGCGGDTKTDGKKGAKAHDDHDHDEHIGANNPHKIELKDAPFNALWGHAGDLVTVTIVDNEYKKAMPIVAEHVLIKDAGGKNEFKLMPHEKSDDGKASEFEKDDEKLEMTMDNKPTISVTVDGKTYTATIVHIH